MWVGEIMSIKYLLNDWTKTHVFSLEQFVSLLGATKNRKRF